MRSVAVYCGSASGANPAVGRCFEPGADDQPLERQTCAAAQRIRMHDRAFAAAGHQAIRLGRLRKQLPDR